MIKSHTRYRLRQQGSYCCFSDSYGGISEQSKVLIYNLTFDEPRIISDGNVDFDVIVGIPL